MTEELVNQAELWSDKGAFSEEMPPRQTVTEFVEGLPEYIQQGCVFKMYVTCDVTYQIDYNTGIKMGAMTGLDTSAVPLSVAGAVKLARETWRGMYEGFGEETRAIILQERIPSEQLAKNIEKYPAQLQKLITVASVLWGIIHRPKK